MFDRVLRFFQNIPDDFVRYSDRSLPHMSLVYEKTHERDGYYYGVLLYPNGPIAIKYGGQYFRFLKLSGIISSWLETNMPGHKILLDFGNKSHQLISFQTADEARYFKETWETFHEPQYYYYFINDGKFNISYDKRPEYCFLLSDNFFYRDSVLMNLKPEILTRLDSLVGKNNYILQPTIENTERMIADNHWYNRVLKFSESKHAAAFKLAFKETNLVTFR